MLSVGEVLDGRYEITGRLGTGGMGEVYRARRRLLGDEVAIKVVRPTADDAEVIRERFLRESRAVARLRHPNIISILDFNVDPAGNRPYLVMEYLNGPSLGEELRARGRFDVESFQHVMAPICSALQLAHECRIVHRDLKPSNIVSHRYETGEIVWKVIDFGLVNMAGGDETALTQAHQFLGTATYAAPEQFSASEVDGRSDLYSLGVIAFELLTGRRPFEGTSVMMLLDQHLNSAPPDVRDLRADVPTEIASAVMRALAKRPADRWPSVAAFSRALVVEDLPTTRMTMPAAPSASPLLATYELGPVIARGRFGTEIHQGMHRALGHPVAIRTFKPSARMDRDAVRARFLKEARALQVPHPNIVQVRDFGESGDVMYVVTDLIEGCSLAQRLADGPLPLEALAAFVEQIADATVAVHRHNGLICGVHPEIARIARSPDGDYLVISSPGLTSLQDLLATIGDDALRGRTTRGTELPYVAPEVLMGKPATRRSDLFTVGVLAYHMAAGKPPFDAPSVPELLGAMLGGAPPILGLRPELGSAAGSVIERCLQTDPAARYDTADALLAAWRSATLTMG